MARRSNQSILKEINPGISLEGIMLKLKFQYFGYLMWRVDSLEKTLMLGRLRAGGEGDDRGWDGWMASRTWWRWVWVNSRSWWWTERPGVMPFMGWQRVRHDWATELNWGLGKLSKNRIVSIKSGGGSETTMENITLRWEISVVLRSSFESTLTFVLHTKKKKALGYFHHSSHHKGGFSEDKFPRSWPPGFIRKTLTNIYNWPWGLKM